MTMTTPMEELDVLNDILSGRKAEKSEIEKEIDRLQAKMKRLTDRRNELRTEIAQDIYRASQISRQVELFKREQEVEKELVKTQTVIDDLVAKEYFWGKSAKEWQIEGAARLALAKRALLGDKRGLGKTLSSLIWRRATGAERTLVLAPKRLVHNYITEAFKWEPDVAVLPVAHSNAKERFNQFQYLENIPEFIVISNYESWRKNPITLEQLKYMQFDAMILDEAHHLMNSQSKAAVGVNQLSQVIDYLLSMTGTPIMNRPQDLWIQLHMIAPDVFPDEKDFLRDYCYQIAQNRWEWRAGSLEKLTQEVLSKFILIRKREDVGIDVPPPAIIDYELDFEGYPLQEEAYQLLTERAVAVLESGKVLSQPSIMTIIMRQRQMLSWPAGIIFNEYDETDYGKILIAQHEFTHVRESAKLDAAKEIIYYLVEEEEPVILSSEFVPLVEELEKQLRKEGIDGVVSLTGKTPKWLANDIEDDFKPDKKNPKYQVLLSTRQTLGEGMSLHRARNMIQVDYPWNPGREDQLYGRIDRMDSEDQATIHRLHQLNSVDGFVRSIIDGKLNLVGGFETTMQLQTALAESLRQTLKK